MTEQEKAIIRQMATYIELGSQGKQQITGRYEDNSGICAMKACMLGARVGQSELELKIKLNIGLGDYPLVQYPVKNQIFKWWIYDFNSPSPLDGVIIALNDVAGWRFDQIVSWLRSIAE